MFLLRFPLANEILAAHEEVEELLQSHAREYNSLRAKLEYLHMQIQNAEELVGVFT